MTWLDAKHAAEALGIDRGTLLNMVSRSTPTLPGHPLQVGSKGRAYYRFRSDLLEGWAQITAGSTGTGLTRKVERRSAPPAPTPRPKGPSLRSRLRAQG